MNGGYSTSHQSQVQSIISRTHIDDLYLRTGDILVSGAQVIGRLVDVMATGDVSIQSVLDTFEMCQSQASFSLSLDGGLPDVTLGDKSKSEAVVRNIAGLVGTEKFLLTVGGQLSLASADVGLRADGVFVKSVTGDHLDDTYGGKQSITVDGETILKALYESSDEDGFYLNAWAGTAQALANNIDAFREELHAAELQRGAKGNAQEFSDRTEPDHDRINQATMAQFGSEIEALVEKWVDDLLGDKQEKPKAQTSPAPKAEHLLKKQTPAFSKKSSSTTQELLASWQGAYELGLESVESPWDLLLGPVRMAKAAIFGTQWLKTKITSALAKSFSKRHIKNAPSMAKRVVERASISEKNAKHIFRKKEGHIPDNSNNRELLLQTISSKRNYLGRDRFGNDWHAQVLADGRQVWTSSRDGLITNGGINVTPKQFNPKSGLSRVDKNGNP